MSKVTVVIVAFNSARFIRESIDSVLNQTYDDIEVIVVCRSSNDGTEEILDSYGNKIRWVAQDGIGIARARNQGFGLAKGDFIAFLDSDDVWHKDKLQKQIEILEKNENLIVWSEGEIIDADGNPTGELFTQKHGASKKKKSGDLFEILLLGNFIFFSSVIFQRKDAKDIRFNEALKYTDDYQYWVDLAKKYEYFFLSESLTKYRIHGGNVTFSDEKGWLRDRIIINDYFLQRYADEIPDKLKSKILLNSIEAFSFFGEKTKALRCVNYAIKSNPFNLWNLYYLFFAFINKKGFIDKFLVWCYQRYVRLIRKY